MRRRAAAPNRNGGRHRCQPPLRRAKDLPVLKTHSEEHVIQALAHQLRRRFPSNHSLVRGASIFYSTALPEGSLVFQSSRLTRRSKPSDVPRPFLGRSLLASRFAFSPRKGSKPRRARGRSTLPAPLPDWPRKVPRELHIACRRRSVLPSPSAPFLPLPAFRWRRGLPSRSPAHNAQPFRVAEVKNPFGSLWITGISGTTVGTNPDSPRIALYGF